METPSRPHRAIDLSPPYFGLVYTLTRLFAPGDPLSTRLPPGQLRISAADDADAGCWCNDCRPSRWTATTPQSRSTPRHRRASAECLRWSRELRKTSQKAEQILNARLLRRDVDALCHVRSAERADRFRFNRDGTGDQQAGYALACNNTVATDSNRVLLQGRRAGRGQFMGQGIFTNDSAKPAPNRFTTRYAQPMTLPESRSTSEASACICVHPRQKSLALRWTREPRNASEMGQILTMRFLRRV